MSEQKLRVKSHVIGIDCAEGKVFRWHAHLGERIE